VFWQEYLDFRLEGDEEIFKLPHIKNSSCHSKLQMKGMCGDRTNSIALLIGNLQNGTSQMTRMSL
jgi:hypothetical protein